MRLRRFRSCSLPPASTQRLRALLDDAHAREPFSPTRPRAAARRVGALAAGVGLSARLYRGGVELTGAEVDHVWLAVDDVVIDLAFPLFSPAFVGLLPRFVAGEIDADELEDAAAGAGIDERILGLLPPRVHYVGAPVWAQRARRDDEGSTPAGRG